MSLTYLIKLNSANYPTTSKYKITYDGLNNIALRVGSNSAAINLSPQELLTGVDVIVPDGTTSLHLYHEECGTQATYSLLYEVKLNNTTTTSVGSASSRLMLYVDGTLVITATPGESKTYLVQPNKSTYVYMGSTSKIPPDGYVGKTVMSISRPHTFNSTVTDGPVQSPTFNIQGNIVASAENYWGPL